MLDKLLLPLVDRPAPRARRSPKPKADSGIGAFWMANEPSISMFRRSPQQMAKDAQGVAVSNRWIRAAERVISHAFGTVPWHLETDDGETVGDDSDPILRAIRDLLEKPYTPLPDDPRNATPRTRSGLWGLTSRHEGVCGSAFWLLDQRNALAGIPLQILYVNPARMTPVGENRLMGWILDADQRGNGYPLGADDVLHFTLEEADQGWFPPGLVETAMSSVNITRYGDRHAAGQLASGGKLPGVFSPKSDVGVMPPDVFATLERQVRSSAEDPDAARRSFVLRGPIDFTPTAATPEQLDLVAVQNMARDDVLELWGVPLSQLGGAPPAGLNSGSTKSYDEAALWQKAVSPRLRRFAEVLQFQFLDPLSAKIGKHIELVIEEPTFDDDAPKYELATKAQNLPLTNNERRALIGLDPFTDEALGNAIVMPMQIVEYGTSVSSRPADDIPLAGVTGDEIGAKATLRSVADRLLPRLRKDLGSFLDEQRKAIAAAVRDKAGHLASRKGRDDASWWKGAEWDARLKKLLAPYANEIANLTAKKAQTSLGKAEFSDLTGNAVLQRLLARLGTRISGINETTRQQVAEAIKAGVEAGDGAAALGDRIEALTDFDEYRAELIARTESARVLNEAQLESFREFGVNRVRAIDGDEDPECAARDGQEFDLDDALDIADHPNGTLDWVPVVGAA